MSYDELITWGQMKNKILQIRRARPRQKLDMILVINWFWNWSYQKIILTKNVLLNSYSSLKKKCRKIRMIFDIENSLWKSNFGTFWGLALQICKKKIKFVLRLLVHHRTSSFYHQSLIHSTLNYTNVDGKNLVIPSCAGATEGT